MNNISNKNTTPIKFEIALNNDASSFASQNRGVKYDAIRATFDLSTKEIRHHKTYLEFAQEKWKEGLPYIWSVVCHVQNNGLTTTPMHGLEAFSNLSTSASKTHYYVLKDSAAQEMKPLCTSQQLKQQKDLQLLFKANSGDAQAKYELAQKYSGEGTQALKHSYKKAFTYFSLAAKQNHADAAYQVAKLIFDDKIAKGPMEGYNFLQIAIELGHIESLKMYLDLSNGLKEKDITSLPWFAKAIEKMITQNSTAAIETLLQYPHLLDEKTLSNLQQQQIEATYLTGMHLLQSNKPSDAFEHFDRAGKQGHVKSLIEQGRLYHNGEIVGFSKKDAISLLSKALELLPTVEEQERKKINKSILELLEGAYLEQANDHLSQKQWDQAIAAFEAVIVKCGAKRSVVEPLKYSAYCKSGKQKFKQYRQLPLNQNTIPSTVLLKEARQALDNLAKTRRSNAYYLMGKIYARPPVVLQNFKDVSKAKSAFEQACLEGHKGALLRLAAQKFETKDTAQEGVAMLTSFAAEKNISNQKDVHYQKKAALQLAVMYEVEGRMEGTLSQAQKYYAQAAGITHHNNMVLHKGLAKAQFNLASIWLNLQEIEETDRLTQALPLLKQAKEQNPILAETKLQEIEARIKTMQEEADAEVLQRQQALMESQKALAASQERKRKFDNLLLDSNKIKP